jgi:transposase
MKFKREALEALSKEELIELLLQMQEQVEELRQEIGKLKKPLTTSRNSSQAPSRDSKANKTEGGAKKQGAVEGHAKMTRAWVEKADREIVIPARVCECGMDVSGVAPHSVVRRQITELPEVKPVVIETCQEVVSCPCCGKDVYGILPAGLEAGRVFGPRVQATVTYLKHEQHLSYERTQEAMATLFGMELSEGGESRIVERAGVAAQVVANEIQQVIRASEVIGSDETSARVKARNWWQWVFVSKDAILHVIQPSRGEDVIKTVMGDAQPRGWVSDCWAPQLNAPAQQHQLCLSHQIRNLQGLIDRCPHLHWARQMQSLFREAIHLSHRREDLSELGFKRRCTELEHRLNRLIDRNVQTPHARALVKRYRKHRHRLLVFLRDPTIPHHNNACERALRGSVIHRKVTNGFRSEWGAHAYAALASVIDTAKLQGKSVFDALLALFGAPVLPFLA